jgi:hypothetical protein
MDQAWTTLPEHLAHALLHYELAFRPEAKDFIEGIELPEDKSAVSEKVHLVPAVPRVYLPNEKD